MKNLSFVFAEKATGSVRVRGSAPDEARIPPCPDDCVIVIPADLVVPRGPVKLNRNRIRAPINYVESIASIQTVWRPKAPPASLLLAAARGKALDQVDRVYSAHIENIRGPLAALHSEKRRQAESGTGALVIDDADRDAILANAIEEDEKVAAIDRERREIKAKLKTASTVEEIEAMMQPSQGLNK